MSKYKVGDVVRRTGEDCANVRKGMTYTVSGLSDAGDTLYLGFGDKGYCSYNFELVQDEPEYLTPEQVLQYFKDGRQDELECSSKVKASGWAEMLPNEDMYVSQINERKWRVKPVPKTIDYYGTELPKPITKAEAIELGLKEVYTVRLPTMFVGAVHLDYIGWSGVLCWATEDDAKLVLDVMLKPFKQ